MSCSNSYLYFPAFCCFPILSTSKINKYNVRVNLESKKWIRTKKSNLKRVRRMCTDSLIQLVIEQYLRKNLLNARQCSRLLGIQQSSSTSLLLLKSCHSAHFAFILTREKVLKGWFMSVAFGLFSKESGVFLIVSMRSCVLQLKGKKWISKRWI